MGHGVTQGVDQGATERAIQEAHGRDRTKDRPRCPLTGDAAVDVLDTLEPQYFIDIFRQDLKIDVAADFAGIETIRLCRARQSGLLFFTPPPVGSEALYRALRAFDWYDPQDKREYALAAGHIPPGARVLDVGAGAGAFAGYLTDADYTGLEPDRAAAETAQHAGLRVRSETLAEHVTGHGPAYDAICAFQVLEHVAAPGDFVAQALRALKPGGLLIIGVPAYDSYLGHLTDFVLDLPPHHVSWWPDEALATLASHFGLETLAIEATPVEPWESRLYWMARMAGGFGDGATRPASDAVARLRQGRARKVAAYLLAGLADRFRRPPPTARGATSVLSARKPEL